MDSLFFYTLANGAVVNLAPMNKCAEGRHQKGNCWVSVYEYAPTQYITNGLSMDIFLYQVL